LIAENRCTSSQPTGVPDLFCTCSPSNVTLGSANVCENLSSTTFSLSSPSRSNFLLAGWTELSHEALSDRYIYSARDDFRINSKIEQAGEGPCSIVCVKSVEKHEVSCKSERSPQSRQFLRVADLSNHDDIRVLAQSASQPFGKGVTLLLIGLCLDNALEMILDRVLNGDDFDVWSIDLPQEGIESGRLARTCRASSEYHAVRFLDFFFQDSSKALGECRASRAVPG
jgi:hypothetical protein